MSARPRCDTPGCGRPIPVGGEGHPEICPRCLEAEKRASLEARASMVDCKNGCGAQVIGGICSACDIKLLAAIGQAAVDYVADGVDCLFCDDRRYSDGAHEDHCPVGPYLALTAVSQ